MTDLREGKLFRAHEPQYHEGIPFQTVKFIKEENQVVTFSTEWPVRELNCELNYWWENFSEMK